MTYRDDDTRANVGTESCLPPRASVWGLGLDAISRNGLIIASKPLRFFPRWTHTASLVGRDTPWWHGVPPP